MRRPWRSYPPDLTLAPHSPVEEREAGIQGRTTAQPSIIRCPYCGNRHGRRYACDALLNRLTTLAAIKATHDDDAECPGIATYEEVGTCAVVGGFGHQQAHERTVGCVDWKSVGDQLRDGV